MINIATLAQDHVAATDGFAKIILAAVIIMALWGRKIEPPDDE